MPLVKLLAASGVQSPVEVLVDSVQLMFLGVQAKCQSVSIQVKACSVY